MKPREDRPGRRAQGWVILGFVLLLLSCSGRAVLGDEAKPSGPLLLSLGECEKIALENNLTTRRSEVGIGVARAAVREAKANMLPHLDLSGRYTRLGPKITLEIPTPDGPEEITVVRELDRNATLTLSQPVYAVGPMRLAPRAADLALDFSESTLANTQDEVILAVRKAFFNCLRAEALLDVSKQRQAQAQAHLKNAEAYYQAGTVTRADVLRAQVEVANGEHLILAAQNGVDLAFIALRNLLNLGQGVALELRVPEVPKLMELDLERCLEAARFRRADVRVANMAVELSKANEALAAAENKPALFLSGDRQWKTGAAFAPTTSWSLSLVASVPIFSAGAGAAKVDRARKETHQKEIDLESLRQGVEAQVRGALLSLEASGKQIEAARVAREQAEEVLRITELQFGEGMARTVEVLDAEVALAQAATNYVNAVYDYEVAKAELARAAGAYSVEEIGEETPRTSPGTAIEETVPAEKEG